MDEENTLTQPQEKVLKQQKKLKSAMVLGASWFYCLAVVSIINSLLIIFPEELTFTVALGVTWIIDYYTQEIGMLARVFTFTVTIIVSCVFLIFGYIGRQGYMRFYMFGMILYALDGLLFFIAMDRLAILFHIFVLINLYIGLQAGLKLKKLQENNNNIL